MSRENQFPMGDKQKIFNLTIAAMVGQVGCLTLFIIIGALFGGLWLDNQLHTKPWFTLGLLLVSVPVSLIVMLVVARKAIAKIKAEPEKKEENQPKEASLGRDS